MQTDIEVFTFGEPESVLDKNLIEYMHSMNMGKWYDPPISMDGLAKSFRASPHHASAIYVKRNILATTFIPHRLLGRQDFSRWALDYLTFGNAYLERRYNRLRGPLKLAPMLAKYTRRSSRDLDTYWFIPEWGKEIEMAAGSVFHLMEPDINQEIYGIPEYIAALNSAWLNESATLFRRRYYRNGSHAGYILYMTDASHNTEDVDAIRSAVKSSKGPGNFRNLFMYAPGGKKDGVQVIPLSEVAAKDEFFNIKAVTRDDLLAAHRVPPQLMGIVPNNVGGFGDISKAAQVFVQNELEPLQSRMMELNDWMGEQIIRFQPYALPAGDG